MAATRVLHRVRQRLLHDAVRAHVDRGRERARLALDRRVDLEPGAAGTVDQLAEAVEAGLRLARRAAVPQQTEQAAHLAQPLAGGALDRGERRARALRVAAEHVLRPARLHDDRGQRVRDGVVHLAGDPLALGRGRLRRALVRVALHREGGVVAAPRDAADGPDAAGEEERRQQVGRGVAARPGLGGDRHGEREQAEREQRVAQRPVGGDRVDGHDRGDRERVDLQRRAREGAARPGPEHERGHDERRPAAERERQRGQRDGRDVERGAAADDVLRDRRAEHLDEGDGEERDGERDVGQRRAGHERIVAPPRRDRVGPGGDPRIGPWSDDGRRGRT